MAAGLIPLSHAASLLIRTSPSSLIRSRVKQRANVALSDGIPWPIGISILSNDRTADERRGHGRATSQADMRYVNQYVQ